MITIKKSLLLITVFIVFALFADAITLRTVYNPFTHLQDYIRTGNFTGEAIIVDNITTNKITLNSTSIDDWSDISTSINNTDLWTNESGVTTSKDLNVDVRGNISLAEKIDMAQNAQMFVDDNGCVNVVAGNPR